MTKVNEAAKLGIGYQKTCDCNEKHINCLTAKEWLKAQIGVWQFYYEGRDVRDKETHPAVFPIQLARKVITERSLILRTKKPDWGSGCSRRKDRCQKLLSMPAAS